MFLTAQPASSGAEVILLTKQIPPVQSVEGDLQPALTLSLVWTLNYYVRPTSTLLLPYKTEFK